MICILFRFLILRYSKNKNYVFQPDFVANVILHYVLSNGELSDDDDDDDDNDDHDNDIDDLQVQQIKELVMLLTKKLLKLL